ncbi:MAG: hypothetical protein ACREO7_08865, partial [Pseudoxanthomonas sp.]
LHTGLIGRMDCVAGLVSPSRLRVRPLPNGQRTTSSPRHADLLQAILGGVTHYLTTAGPASLRSIEHAAPGRRQVYKA